MLEDTDKIKIGSILKYQPPAWLKRKTYILCVKKKWNIAVELVDLETGLDWGIFLLIIPWFYKVNTIPLEKKRKPKC